MDKAAMIFELNLDKARRRKQDLNPYNFLKEIGGIHARSKERGREIPKKDIARLAFEAIDRLVEEFKQVVKEKLSMN